ncbi:MAG: hypothetical protein ACI8XO_004122 [Verrucomicrobiales bacterium]|jgi:hypothetical protein
MKNKIETKNLMAAVLCAVRGSLCAFTASAAQPQKDGTSHTSPARIPPNIIFILADDMGYILSRGGTGALSIRAGKWKLLVGQGECGY